MSQTMAEHALALSSEDLLIRRETVGLALGALNERERGVVDMRAVHGTFFREIGAEFGVSGNRVWQIYTNALRKMRRKIRLPEIKTAPEKAFHAFITAEKPVRDLDAVLDCVAGRLVARHRVFWPTGVRVMCSMDAIYDGMARLARRANVLRGSVSHG